MIRLFVAASAVVAAVMAVSAGARADFRDGNGLYADCSKESSRALCDAYIAAIADAASKEGGVVSFKICPSGDVLIAQMEDVVKQYLAEHPEQRHLSAASLVAFALARAFPCPR
jgi:hypothetical protein